MHTSGIVSDFFHTNRKDLPTKSKFFAKKTIKYINNHKFVGNVSEV